MNPPHKVRAASALLLPSIKVKAAASATLMPARGAEGHPGPRRLNAGAGVLGGATRRPRLPALARNNFLSCALYRQPGCDSKLTNVVFIQRLRVESLRPTSFCVALVEEAGRRGGTWRRKKMLTPYIYIYIKKKYSWVQNGSFCGGHTGPL